MARRFGHTWWGRAWIDALEHRASLDPNRLPRGRTYARAGNVASVETSPGAISARVRGRRPGHYRVTIRFRTLTDAEWDRVLEIIVAKAARSAALLDGELDPDLVADAAGAGVDLLPHAGELGPRCSCPDWADPCKHAAAACYVVADELDADPFVLLRLRGRDRDEVLAAVRQRRSGPGPTTAEDAGSDPIAGDGAADRGVVASEAWARPLGALPEVPHLRAQPGRVAAWPVDPPPEAPFSAAGLGHTAADAARRAWAALADREPLGLDLTVDEDLARRGAVMLGSDDLAALARRGSTTPRALARRAIAWRVAGPAGLGVLDEVAWRPDPATMAAARDAVVAAGVAPGRVRVDRNRLVIGEMALRLARGGGWYRFAKRGNAWELDAGPADDPDDLIES